MKKLLLTSALLMLTLFTKAQTFKKFYTEFFEQIIFDHSGKLTTTVYDYPNESVLNKIDNKGLITPGPEVAVDYVIEFIETSDNGYLYSALAGGNGNLLMKIDQDGTELWSKTVDAGLQIFEDDQNNYIISKRFSGSLVTKLDASGNILWEKDYNFCTLAGVGKSVAGYMAGGTLGQGAMIIAKTNYAGDTLYSKKYLLKGGTDYLKDFIAAGDGGYLASASNGVVYRFDSSGDTIWSKKIVAGPNYSIVSGSGHFYILENFRQIYKVTLDGVVLWNKIASSVPMEQVHEIAVAPDGGVAVACSTYVEDKKTLLIRYDADGNIFYNNNIKGKVFKDNNDNCTADSGEPTLKGILIEVTPGPLYAITDDTGYYSVEADTGVNYTITPKIENLHLLESHCNPTYQVLFPGSETGTNAVGKDFALRPILCPDITASFNGGFRMVRCIEQYHIIDCRNRGNVLAENVTVTLEVPSNYEVISSSVNYNRVDNKLTFLLEDLDAGKDTVIVMKGKISCSATLNTFENFRTIATTTTTCQYDELSNDTTISLVLVAGSFDPNDKQVFPSKINFNDYNNGKKEVRYLIRFQNTGNSEAINIKVMDTLSSMLDLSSIRNISTSHSSRLEVINGTKPVLKWSFDDINLTYQSEDEVESQGYISFTIDLKENLPDATVLPNNAYIYFDFNDPVITNEAEIKISSEEETDRYKEEVISSVAKASEKDYSFTVTPNPVSDRAEINMLPLVFNARLSLFNSKGEKVVTLDMKEGKAILETEKYSQGIYYFQVYDEKGALGSGKIVIK